MSGTRCDILLYSFMEYTYGQKEFLVIVLVSVMSSTSCRYKANHTAYNTLHYTQKSFSHVI